MGKSEAVVGAKVKAKPADMRVVGTSVMRALVEVKPNTWNPNRMTPYLKQSLKHGLRTDGWLASQALLIWGTDEKGKKKNVIIDGEHRWTVACELGFVSGPMVMLEKITEVQAKALTVKMNQKRGEFDDKDLGELLRDIQFDLKETDMPMAFGFSGEEMAKLLAEKPIPDVEGSGGRAGVIGTTPGEVGSGMTTHVNMVQVFFNKQEKEEFLSLVKQLAPVFGTKNVSDTSLEALRRVSTAQKSRS